jgi:hypothetical protein
MQIPYRQRRRLRRIEHTLRRSDPRLAMMLAIFTELHASDALASPEQRARAHGMAACLLGAAAWLMAGLSACAGALARLANAAWRVARGRLRAAQHSQARTGSTTDS